MTHFKKNNDVDEPLFSRSKFGIKQIPKIFQFNNLKKKIKEISFFCLQNYVMFNNELDVAVFY